jgi:hypothetical protein
MTVSHYLLAEVYFSIWGEDAAGRQLPRGGPGAMRVIKIRRPLVLPHVSG